MREIATQEKTAINLGEPSDSHLRNMQGILGYHIHTSEGLVGHVSDFMMDDKSWEIHYLEVTTGVWFAGQEILISPKNIDRISYDESTVFVNVPMSDLKNAG